MNKFQWNSEDKVENLCWLLSTGSILWLLIFTQIAFTQLTYITFVGSSICIRLEELAVDVTQLTDKQLYHQLCYHFASGEFAVIGIGLIVCP
jgi:hypothetical protein